MLKIAVCIKQIPLIEDANFDPETKTIKRDGPNVISAFDLRALALAMELKQRFGAETAAVTMGPPQASTAVQDALAMGLDRAVHIQDRALAGSDTLATARALAAWLKQEKWDLVLLGKYSLDSETGQVGPEIAEMLGIAQITGVRKLKLEGKHLRAERESDEGFEEIECDLPALLTCAERVAQPIKIKAETVEAAKSKPIEVVGVKELECDPAQFGLNGSPTWVREIRFQKREHRQGKIIEFDSPADAVSKLVSELQSLGALTPRPRARKPTAPQIRISRPGRDVWVACETDLSGKITRATLELLSRAAELALTSGGAVVAVGPRTEVDTHHGELAGYGADLVLALDNPELANYSPELFAHAFGEAVQEHKPWALLLPATERGRDWGPRLAARLGLGLTGDAIGLEVDEEQRLVALKPAFGGNVVAPILSRTFPQMATVRPGVLELAHPAHSRKATATTFSPGAGKRLSRTVAAHSLLDHSISPLDGAEVIVGIGTGVGGIDGVAELQKLARVLDAAMCATRRVTDLGWVPRQIQVGLTGKAIDPRLYFAIGIRGAPNHTVGIKRAETIVAINKDPEAPIFEIATLGIVADWSEIVPPLTVALAKALERGAS